jgi:hypothetical protein
MLALAIERSLDYNLLIHIRTHIMPRHSLSFANYSDEVRRDALIRISQFVLRGETEQMRQELQENVVEMALFLLDSQRVASLEDIIRIMKEKILVDFPRPVLKAILFRLIGSGKVTPDNVLSTQRRTEIESQTRNYSKALDDMTVELAEKTERSLGAPLTPDQKHVVMGTLFKFLSVLFMRRADISARLITSQEVGDSALRDPLADLNKSTESIEDKPLRDATKNAILETLEKPSDIVARFLLHLNENLVCVQVLNLDPECQTLEREAFAKKNLVLDTNVIIALLCPSSRQHRLSRELVNLTREIGARMLITERTLKEFTKVLDDANTQMKGLKSSIPVRFLEAVDDDFIASFAIEKQLHPHEQWQGYYLRTQHVKSILKNNYGIELLGDDRPEILERTYFSEIAGKVSDCFVQTRGKPKKKAVADHDAYHLILVRELSKESSPTMVGSSHWFLSHDQTLAYVEPLLRTKLGDGKTVSALVSEIWLQIIEPFLSRDVREKQAVQVFAELLSSQFSSVPFRIKQSVLAEVQGDWLNYEGLETDDLETILGEKFVSDYLSKVREFRGAGQDTKDVSEQFGKQLDDRLKTLAGQKIRSLGDELKGLQGEIQLKKDTEDDLRAELISERRFSRIWRACSGVAGLTMIFSNLMFISTRMLEFNAFTTAYFMATFLFGAILVFIAIAPGNVIVRLEAALRS